MVLSGLSPETWLTFATDQFLGLSFTAPVGCGFLLVTAILEQIGQALGDTTNIVWIAGGWSVAGSTAFSLAGSLSDVFGRRNIVLAGQFFTLVGAVGSIILSSPTTILIHHRLSQARQTPPDMW